MVAMTTSAYPPPPFYRLCKDYDQDPSSTLEPPPPPPIDQIYTTFGADRKARATLIHMLESQIQSRKKAIEDIKQRREEAQKLLGESLLILDGSQTN